MPLNPAEVLELHVRFIEARDLKQVLSMGSLSPFVVLSSAVETIRTPDAPSAGQHPNWNHKVRAAVARSPCCPRGPLFCQRPTLSC